MKKEKKENFKNGAHKVESDIFGNIKLKVIK